MPATKTTIETRSELDAFLANPERDWSKAILYGLVLSPEPLEQRLLLEKPTGAVLIGCTMKPKIGRASCRERV